MECLEKTHTISTNKVHTPSCDGTSANHSAAAYVRASRDVHMETTALIFLASAQTRTKCFGKCRPGPSGWLQMGV